MTTIYLVVWESDEYEKMYDIDSVWDDLKSASNRLDKLNRNKKYTDYEILPLEVNQIFNDFEYR